MLSLRPREKHDLGVVTDLIQNGGEFRREFKKRKELMKRLKITINADSTLLSLNFISDSSILKKQQRVLLRQAFVECF